MNWSDAARRCATRGTPLLEFLEPFPRVVYSQDIILNMNSHTYFSRIAWSVACSLACALALICMQASAEVQHPATLTRLSGVDSVIEKAVADGNIPGAVLVVGHDGAVIYRKAYGNRALEPKREPMTLDTVFDLASLTKVIATTTAMMQLVQQGKVRMNDPVAKYLPEFAQNGKEDITVRQLMTHYSGLAPDLDLKDAVGREGHGIQHGVCRATRNHARVGVRLQRH